MKCEPARILNILFYPAVVQQLSRWLAKTNPFGHGKPQITGRYSLKLQALDALTYIIVGFEAKFHLLNAIFPIGSRVKPGHETGSR